MDITRIASLISPHHKISCYTRAQSFVPFYYQEAAGMGVSYLVVFLNVCTIVFIIKREKRPLISAGIFILTARITVIPTNVLQDIGNQHDSMPVRSYLLHSTWISPGNNRKQSIFYEQLSYRGLLNTCPDYLPRQTKVTR